MPISNAEKQARFRQKEELKKRFGQVFRECQLALPRGYSHLKPNEVEARLNAAVELPSAWTDQDLARAFRRIENVRLDVFGTGDPVGNDVYESRHSFEELSKSPNPGKLWKEVEKAKQDTFALAGHLRSALELSQLRSEDQAAALMEVVRHVGRALANSTLEGQSDAITICLATVDMHYERPDWFNERFANLLRFRLDDDTRKELGALLIKDDGSS